MNATALIQVRMAANSNTLTAISALTVIVAGFMIPVLSANAFIGVLFLFCLLLAFVCFDDVKMRRHVNPEKFYGPFNDSFKTG